MRYICSRSDVTTVIRLMMTLTEPERRIALIDEIRSAFHDVSLGDGVSAEEAWVLDAYGTEEERTEARRSRQNLPWERVAESRVFEEFVDLFCFLDAKGSRFYLPACMIWVLEELLKTKDLQMAEYLLYALCPNRKDENDPVNREDAHPKMARYKELNGTQATAVARFLEFMCEYGDEWDSETAQQALDQYWDMFLVGV